MYSKQSVTDCMTVYVTNRLDECTMKQAVPQEMVTGASRSGCSELSKA